MQMMYFWYKMYENYFSGLFSGRCAAPPNPAKNFATHPIVDCSTKTHRASGPSPAAPAAGAAAAGSPASLCLSLAKGLGLSGRLRNATRPRFQDARASGPSPAARGGGRRGEPSIPLPSSQGLGHERAARAASSLGDRQRLGEIVRQRGETWIRLGFPAARSGRDARATGGGPRSLSSTQIDNSRHPRARPG